MAERSKVYTRLVGSRGRFNVPELITFLMLYYSHLFCTIGSHNVESKSVSLRINDLVSQSDYGMVAGMWFRTIRRHYVRHPV